MESKINFNLYCLTRNTYLITIIFSFVLVFCIIKLQQKNLTTIDKNQMKNHVKLEKLKQSNLELVKNSPGFGFDNLLANFVFLDYVQYFGDNFARDKTGYELTPDYFQAVVKHDPRFVDAYLHLAPASTLFAGQPQRTVAIMSKGLKSMNPELDKSYLVWTYKAVDELLFLGDQKAAQNSYLTGAEWATYHTDQRSKVIGSRAKETAQFLASNPDSKKAQASSWMMIFSNARDQQTRQMALQRIESLGGEVIITENKITVKMPEDDKS